MKRREKRRCRKEEKGGYQRREAIKKYEHKSHEKRQEEINRQDRARGVSCGLIRYQE